MRVAVVGAGAMGSVFGGYLAEAGNEVTLVDVNRQHVDAVAAEGLVLEFDEGSTVTTHPRAVMAGARIEADSILVLAKAYMTAQVGELVADAMSPSATVITLQNGLGNDEVLAAACGAERVAAGTTTVGAEYLRPGRVAVARSTASGESSTQIGTRTGAADGLGLQAVAAKLSAAGLPTSVSDAIDVPIWRKVAMAGSAGSLTAVLCLRLDDLLRDAGAAELLERAVAEVVAVARACGAPLDEERTWQEIRSALERGGSHLTSMAADLLAGRPTENEALLGAVARRGGAAGVATPVSSVLTDLIAALERTRDHRMTPTS